MKQPKPEDVVTLCNHLQDLRGRALSTWKAAQRRGLAERSRAAKRRTAEGYRDAANALLRLLQLHDVWGLPETLVLTG